jgi:hypothetical protein
MSTTTFSTRWELRDRIDAISAEVGLLAGSAPYVVYLILDPRRADPAGEFEGLPLYVGESADPARRVKSHFRRGLSRQGSAASIHNELYRMALAQRLPIFQILEVCHTRSESLIAETRWAQRLLAAGYQLFNKLPEQTRQMDAKLVARYNGKRLWGLTLEEADRSGVEMKLACPSGCFETRVDIKHFAGGDFPNRRLSLLKKYLQPCTCCGKRLRTSLRLPPAPVHSSV